jgi:hypothetical protein
MSSDLLDEMPHIIGFAPIMDEMECIEGWFKNIRYFCHEVWAIYDPRSTDGTTEWLKKKAEETKNDKVPLKLFEQDINQGDSTRAERGVSEEITYLIEVNRFMHTIVPEGTWCIWLAADERLDLKDRESIFNALNQADATGANSLRFEIFDIYPDEKHRVAYENIPGLILNHKKIFRRGPNTYYGTRAHANEGGMWPMLNTKCPFYHLGWIKSIKQECWWRSWDGINLVKKMAPGTEYKEIKLPFKDWRHEA